MFDEMFDKMFKSNFDNIKKNFATDFVGLLSPDFAGDHTHIEAEVVREFIREHISPEHWEQMSIEERERTFEALIREMREEFDIPVTCQRCERQVLEARGSTLASSPDSIGSVSPREANASADVDSVRASVRHARYIFDAADVEPSDGATTFPLHTTLIDTQGHTWSLDISLVPKMGDPESKYPYVVLARLLRIATGSEADALFNKSFRVTLRFPIADIAKNSQIRWAIREGTIHFDYLFSPYAEQIELGEARYTEQEQSALTASLEEIIKNVSIGTDFDVDMDVE